MYLCCKIVLKKKYFFINSKIKLSVKLTFFFFAAYETEKAVENEDIWRCTVKTLEFSMVFILFFSWQVETGPQKYMKFHFNNISYINYKKKTHLLNIFTSNYKNQTTENFGFYNSFHIAASVLIYFINECSGFFFSKTFSLCSLLKINELIWLIVIVL